MNIEGLDYNTQREQLVLPEYGREIQSMVDLCVGLESREERQACAETIVTIMDRMFPQNREDADYQQRLWDHLAIMSRFQLDIEWPYDISEARKMSAKPTPIAYASRDIPVRHYGKIIFEIFDKLKTMEPSEEREALVRLTANQMKPDLMAWSHGSCDDEKVASDLAKYTDGRIQLDLNTFVFDKIAERPSGTGAKRKKR